jgi:hypothetical protein
MNLDKSIKKLDRLFAKRAKIEYNLAVSKGAIIELQDKIEKERNILQSKLDVIEKSVPRTPTFTESVEHMTAKKDIELADAAKYLPNTKPTKEEIEMAKAASMKK